MDRQQFIQELAQRFPEVASQFGAYSHGLLHCEIADFRRVVEVAMDAGQLWRVELYLRFLERCRALAGPELLNAIDVSFLEDFARGEMTDGRRQAVRERMPARLRQQMISMDGRRR